MTSGVLSSLGMVALYLQLPGLDLARNLCIVLRVQDRGCLNTSKGLGSAKEVAQLKQRNPTSKSQHRDFPKRYPYAIPEHRNLDPKSLN